MNVSCPEHQRAFGGSCYEFVGLQRTFLGAQAWCEHRGGHLVFIADVETQHFLQRHLDPEKDMWFGAAPSASTDLQYSPSVEGPLSWLDGSQITYSRWVSSPQSGAACGHILKDSGFQWEATRDCGKKLPFICQFESGRFIACAGHGISLQCGSGQALMIDGGFYGRKNIHYCRATHSPPTTPTQLQCGWVDVEETFTAHCHGRQVCLVTDIMDSFGEPCPQLGSYLSLDYHCQDGLALSLSTVAAVFDDVTISVKWLFSLRSGNLTCKLSTGEGQNIYLPSPEGLDSSVVHKYTDPGVFAVTAECNSSDTQITAQKIITVQEPIREFGVITCFASKLSFHGSDCKALYGEEFHIQVEVKEGTNVTYRIQSDDILLSVLSTVGGKVPHNITVTPEMVKQLGQGCHQLTLYASNMVTFPEVSADLQVCVLEKVSGLQASMLSEQDGCLDYPDITVSVTLERGAPVLLLFFLTGDNSSFSESRQMHTRKDVFHITHQIQGPVHVKLRALNAFSSVEANVNMFSSCGKDPVVKVKHIRVARSTMELEAKPKPSVNKKEEITVKVKKLPSNLDDSEKYRYQWRCANPCKCQGNFEGQSHTIEENCLPGPFEYNKYHFEVINRDDNDVEETDYICVTVKPSKLSGSTNRPKCVEGCDPIQPTISAKMEIVCESDTCDNLVWHIEDLRDDSFWPPETKSCYKDENERPLLKKNDGGTQYTVSPTDLALALSLNKNLRVVVTNEDDDKFYYNDNTIGSSPQTTTSFPASTAAPATTTANTAASTTSTTSSDISSTTAVTNDDTTTAATTSDTSSSATTDESGLNCSISPQSGTVLDAFNLTCNTAIQCSNCQYCFTIHEGKHLRCSGDNEVKSVFLPLGDSSANYKLIITATAKKGQFVVSTTITATVLDSSSSSVETLKNSVDIAVAQLKETGQLSGEALGQIFASVGDKLNSQSDPSEKAERQKLREQMLDVLADSVKQVPSSTAAEVQMTATALNAVMKEGSELSPAAQEEASLLLVNLSSSLLHMELNSEEMQLSANVIVEGASTILDFPSTKNLTDSLLLSLTNTQSALLSCIDAKKGPAIVQNDHIGLFVQRATPEHLNTETINVPNSTSTTFTLPKIPSDLFSSDEPVDVRMLSLYKNPFSWNPNGNISGVTGSLSLTTKNGSGIPVDNLSEEIEILLPRPAGEQVYTSFLDLGNYSTTVINLPSADMTLVLKMVPSSDPLPFKLFLGYKDYPTDKNHVAMTEMPHQGATQEERYTWVLEPNILKGDTGVYYLVVRPIVGPGIKSINASLSITSITTACKFWDESKLDWNTYGCRVGVKTTHLVTQCLCTHLTFFGSSFFVTPNLVDPSRTAELFATFAENPVVVCFVGALFVVYLLVVVWARRKDIKDVAKVQVTVLEDNDPTDEYRYLLSVCTGHRRGAATSSQVTITLLGAEGHSEPHHLKDPKKCLFERGALDMFLLTTPFSLGDLQGIRLWHNNSGSHPAWYVGNVIVQDLQTKQKWHFLCNSWLAIDVGDCCLDKVCPVSSENDLKRFSNLFFMKTTRDFSDGHLWYSVVSRPASSTFTCVQRVSCCFSLLLCTMLTSIMFYGIPTDPSEQTMDLGHFEFTWQQFMVGVQSSLIMFPVNILIVSIFRNTRPRETSCCRRTTEKPDAHGQTTSIDRNVNVTLETVIRDIMKIVHTLSGTMKRSVPCADFGSRQQVDINAALSVLEDFIKQSNKPSDSTQVKAQSIRNLDHPHTPEGSDGMCPGSSMELIQKKSNKTQYLYRQLCRIDQELSLLGPSMFSNPQSYSRALQQVHSMKGSLEDQLFKFGCVNQDKVTQQKLNPADSTDGDGIQKKRVCCHGGLPWWFIFFGWLLVIATSVVAGYYTMLYGLKFGKERSISWLISMIVSFFQSVLVIQPLKVLCLAVFFALVIKSVDEEDFQNVDLIGSDTIPGEIKDKQAVRMNSSVYEPPPPADIERMRRNQIMEQKAFALLRDILTYVGFLWMLLLVAYGQRDPNAFFLNQHIQKSFSENIPESMSLGDVFDWANTTLLRNLFGVYPGFITDGNSKLVGNARLRQLRVQKSSCQIAGSMLQLVPDCHALYSWDEEDMGSYDTSWNQSVMDNTTTGTSSPWGYQTQAQLRAYPIWGTMVLYRGGGFVAELGPDLQNATKTLEYLFRNKWLDMYTRAIFVEFTVYNANVNLFCIVTLLLETTAVGAFQFKSELQSIRLYQSTGGLYIFVMAAEIIYMLFILYYMFQQGKLMKQQRCAYFKSKWNLLELTIILLSWGAVAVFIKRTLTGNRDMTYYQNHKDQFASFYETATADSLLQYLIAFLVLLSTVKLWHLLRLNPKMNMITATLQRAWHDISGFLMIIVVMLVAYSIACNVIYGWTISSYKTLGDALVTIISLQIGIFNYDEVLNSSPVLGGVLFGSCIVLMTFVVLNLLLSVILVAFNQEQTYHKPSDEEEVVDLLLKKIFSLFGIRYKNTQDNPRPDVNEGSRLTLNDNTNILHNSPTDVNSKTPVKSEEL